MKRLSILAVGLVLAGSAQAFAGLTSTDIVSANTDNLVADATPSGNLTTVEAVTEALAVDSNFELITLDDESPQVVEVEEAMPIPEPAAAAILFAGLGSMAWMRYRLG